MTISSTSSTLSGNSEESSLKINASVLSPPSSSSKSEMIKVHVYPQPGSNLVKLSPNVVYIHQNCTVARVKYVIMRKLIDASTELPRSTFFGAKQPQGFTSANALYITIDKCLAPQPSQQIGQLLKTVRKRDGGSEPPLAADQYDMEICYFVEATYG